MSTIKLKKSEVPQFLLDAAKKAFPDYHGRKYAEHLAKLVTEFDGFAGQIGVVVMEL